MSEDDTPGPIQHVEVSVGWNSPPPRLNFPESLDSGDVSTSSVHAEPVKEAKYECPTTDVLGIYSSLLPASSPPRPRRRVRKRKPESPLRGVRQPRLNSGLAAESLQSAAALPPVVEVQQSIIPSEASSDDLLALSKAVNPSRPEARPPSMLAGLDESDEDTDSDLEDLLKLAAPVRFSSTYFSSQRVLRLMVQRVVAVSNSDLQLHCTYESGQSRVVMLGGSWRDTLVQRGDVLHVVKIENGRYTNVESGNAQTKLAPLVLTDECPLFALINPDILIPCTSVAEALSCERQVVLKNRVRAPADLNQSLVLGSIKHEFIQACFVNNIVNKTAEMKLVLERISEANELDLTLVDLDIPTAMEKLSPLINDLQRWARSIWGSSSPGRQVEFHHDSDALQVRLTRAAYIEEEVRSPYLGLVGKIDATCEAVNLSTWPEGGKQSRGTRLVALEIKTGKESQSIAHRAQTSLYTLLLSERHPFNTHPWALLYYTETGNTYAVNAKLQDLRALLQRRNKIAHDLWQLAPGLLPDPTASSPMTCKWCSRSTSCVVYTAVIDKGSSKGASGLAELYGAAVVEGKLEQSFLRFLDHWHHLLDLEYNTADRKDQLRERQWWLKEPQPRHWTVTKKELRSSDDNFVYQVTPDLPAQKDEVAAHSLEKDEFIILSTKQHMGTTFGVVVEVSDSGMMIRVRDRLLSSAKYRIDGEKWSTDFHLGLARYNLNGLLENDRLRELIVDLKEPRFALLNPSKLQTTIEWASSRVLPSSQSGPGVVRGDTADQHLSQDLRDQERDRNLNTDQVKAVDKVLAARDYALILGMPGTGKTTTIAAIVATLVERGKSVLLSAYTNSAVDTIVLKLLAAKVRCLRLTTSRLENVHPDVMPVAVSTGGASGSHTSLVEFLDCPVVACTSHSASNKLFSLRSFDYCILDEASQITTPFCLGPLQLAPIFVLVGDHYQLPPLVKSLKARELGMTDSLFKTLCEAHPQSVIELRQQYRMCADIMSLSSELVYGGRLVCGSEEVARQKLELVWAKDGANYPNWQAIDPDNRVIFLNTDALGYRAYESESNQGYSNNAEAAIIKSIVDQFHRAKLSMKDLAVISVYRHQLSYLKKQLSKFVENGMEVLTADQAQGRDKSCILVSLVRSNERHLSGELLKDWRRLNVAFTRAKQKLVIVGSKRTMKQASGVSSFFELIERRHWVYDAVLP